MKPSTFFQCIVKYWSHPGKSTDHWPTVLELVDHAVNKMATGALGKQVLIRSVAAGRGCLPVAKRLSQPLEGGKFSGGQSLDDSGSEHDPTLKNEVYHFLSESLLLYSSSSRL